MYRARDAKPIDPRISQALIIRLQWPSNRYRRTFLGFLVQLRQEELEAEQRAVMSRSLANLTQKSKGMTSQTR